MPISPSGANYMQLAKTVTHPLSCSSAVQLTVQNKARNYIKIGNL